MRTRLTLEKSDRKATTPLTTLVAAGVHLVTSTSKNSLFELIRENRQGSYRKSEINARRSLSNSDCDIAEVLVNANTGEIVNTEIKTPAQKAEEAKKDKQK